MLKPTRPDTYHTFRLPYWDWRREIQKRDGISPFTAARLGAVEENNTSQVTGDIFRNWNTVCWFSEMNESISEPLCNPNDINGQRQLQRCPRSRVSGQYIDPCAVDNEDWPTVKDVNDALGKSTYDASNFSRYTNEGFRNFLEGFVPVTTDECNDNKFCDTDDDILRKLHNTVSLCYSYIIYLYISQQAYIYKEIEHVANYTS